MKTFFITFRSITHAQRCERLFGTEGITCHLRRTPRWMEERGCGYGVEAKLTELEQGLELLRRERVPFRKSYLFHCDGMVEELCNGIS